MSQIDAIIIGGGLAGLCCARHLHQEGLSFTLLEASDGPGGRVRTDELDGFLLDRGFQVLLTAYPEAQDVLDYDALDLCTFVPGALVRKDGQFFRISDPWREPGTWFRNFFSPIGSMADKFRLSRLRSHVLGRSIEELFDAPEMSTRQALDRYSFSPRFIEEFFRPWFGGIQLESKLNASSRMFEFIFRMMSDGDVAVPARGMGQIPAQLAAALPEGSLRLNARVQQIDGRTVTLTSGETLTAPNIVVATEGPESNRLLRVRMSIPSRSVTCLYFAAPEAPIDEPILVLGGSGRGLINNLAVMSNVSPSYAPAGQHLVCVTVVGLPTRDERSLITNISGQLKRWFGSPSPAGASCACIRSNTPSRRRPPRMDPGQPHRTRPLHRRRLPRHPLHPGRHGIWPPRRRDPPPRPPRRTRPRNHRSPQTRLRLRPSPPPQIHHRRGVRNRRRSRVRKGDPRLTFDRALLAANLGPAFFLTGLIWTIQIVHYPLFDRVGPATFPAYESAHTARITPLVGPLMLFELVAAIALVFARPSAIPAWTAWTALALVALIWTSTFLLQVPRHAQLAAGFDAAAHAALLASNWIRTAAWSARSALLLWLSFRS